MAGPAHVPQERVRRLTAPIFLAIDTCTRRSSVALRDANACVPNARGKRPPSHRGRQRAHPRLMQLAHRAGDIGALAVAIGPGSFTGVRCGLAIAKGIATARSLPLIGVTAFDIIAAAQPDRRVPVYALVEAGRGRVAACRYEWHEGGHPRRRMAHHTRRSPSRSKRPRGCAATSRPRWPSCWRRRLVAPAPLNLRRAGYLAEIGYRAGSAAKRTTQPTSCRSTLPSPYEPHGTRIWHTP